MFSSLELTKIYMVSVLDKKIICLIMIVILSSLAYAIADADQDGVPDSEDQCAGSDTTVVDILGCSCSQKTNGCAENWCCLDDGNTCTDSCGQIGGKAYCNLWNYNLCPNDQITQNQNTAAANCIAYNQNTNDINGICCTGFLLKEDLNSTETKMTCCNPSQCSKNKECVNANTLVGQKKCVNGEWTQIAVQQTDDIVQQEDDTIVGQGYNAPVQNQQAAQIQDDLTGTRTGQAIVVNPDTSVEQDSSSWWYIILIVMVCIGIATFVYSENTKKKDLEVVMNYLQENLKKGYPAIALKQKLEQEGWGADIIENAFNRLLTNK